MAQSYDHSGVITPPLSENGRCHSAEYIELLPCEVNKGTSTTIRTPPLSPSAPPPGGRRNRLLLQKDREVNRSKQFTTRLRRSAPEDKAVVGWRKRNFQQRQRISLGSESSIGTSEDQKTLTKMAYAEQQKWITVQQKTFTKWYLSDRDWKLAGLIAVQVEHENRTERPCG